MSLPAYTFQCGMKYSGKILQTLRDKKLILSIEKDIRGDIGSVIGDRYFKSDENKQILYIYAENVYGYAMSESLPYDEFNFGKIFRLEDILTTPDKSDIGFFIEVDLKYPDKTKSKNQKFPLCSREKENWFW